MFPMIHRLQKRPRSATIPFVAAALDDREFHSELHSSNSRIFTSAYTFVHLKSRPTRSVSRPAQHDTFLLASPDPISAQHAILKAQQTELSPSLTLPWTVDTTESRVFWLSAADAPIPTSIANGRIFYGIRVADLTLPSLTPWPETPKPLQMFRNPSYAITF